MEALGLRVTAAQGCAQWIKWDGWSWVHMPIILALEKWGQGQCCGTVPFYTMNIYYSQWLIKGWQAGG